MLVNAQRLINDNSLQEKNATATLESQGRESLLSLVSEFSEEK